LPLFVAAMLMVPTAASVITLGTGLVVLAALGVLAWPLERLLHAAALIATTS
jgi:hypothetical protein